MCDCQQFVLVYRNYSVRPTPDFGFVLFTLKEWDKFYLALAFVKNSEFPTQQKAASHISHVILSDRTSGYRSINP